MLKIRLVKTPARVIAAHGDGFLPPPCICPDPACRHCGEPPPFCPLLIDYPSE